VGVALLDRGDTQHEAGKVDNPIARLVRAAVGVEDLRFLADDAVIGDSVESGGFRDVLAQLVSRFQR
jgi:hypothetical protein